MPVAPAPRTPVPPVQPSPEEITKLRAEGAKIDRSAGSGMAWAFIVFGLMWIGFGVWSWWHARAMLRWPSAQATIASADVTSTPVLSSPDDKGRRHQTGTDYEINVVFHYFASDGFPHDVRLRRVEVWNDKRSAELRLRHYAVGTERRIIYDPEMVVSIALGPPPGSSQGLVAFGVIGSLISGFGLWLRSRQG